MFHERLDELATSIKQCTFTSSEGDLNHVQALKKACDLLHKTRENGGIVYVIGNGGSAGIASHFHTDLVKTLKIPAQTLYDANLMTCLGNDLGYEHVFSSTLQLMLTPKDLLVAISSSGKSQNILNAATLAKSRKATLFTLSGFADNNPLRSLGDLNYYVNVSDYGLVETGHFFLLHTIVDTLNHHAKQNQIS